MGWLSVLGAVAGGIVGLVPWIVEQTNREAHPGRTEEEKPPAWTPRSYAKGVIVSFAGANYVCVTPHNAAIDWTPINYPAGWYQL